MQAVVDPNGDGGCMDRIQFTQNLRMHTRLIPGSPLLAIVLETYIGVRKKKMCESLVTLPFPNILLIK